MRNDNCKNQTTQLPDQVAAAGQFDKLLEQYFDMNSLKGINGTLLELISAYTSEDLRSGNHGALDTCAIVSDVRVTCNLIRKSQQIIPDIKSDSAVLNSILLFDFETFENLIYRALDCWIYQEDDFEDASMQSTLDITTSFNEVYNWLSTCQSYLTEKGGQSC